MTPEKRPTDADRSIPAVLSRLDLSPLHANCLLQSNERRETYDCIATALCDYGLSWAGGVVDARAYAASTGRLSIYEIQYGDEVSITPRLHDGFALARVSLTKGIEVEADGSLMHVPEGAVYFSAPRTSVRLRWQAQCRQLLVRIPIDLLAQGSIGARRVRRSGCMLAPSLVPLFLDQVNLALGIAERGSELVDRDGWVAHAEAGLARFAAAHLFERPAGGADQPAPRQLARDWPERLKGFILARLKSPLMLDDLTRALGIGRSQLNIACQNVFGCAPMQLVRLLRLEAARADLQHHPDQDLTMLALRYGFDHQSRFAQYYKRQFNELPRETRRRLVQ